MVGVLGDVPTEDTGVNFIDFVVLPFVIIPQAEVLMIDCPFQAHDHQY